MASPLFGLLAKDSYFILYGPFQEDFELIKKQLTTTPILRGPNWTFPFHIDTDASEKAVGAALGQLEEKIPYAIYFISKNLSEAKLNYVGCGA